MVRIAGPTAWACAMTMACGGDDASSTSFGSADNSTAPTASDATASTSMGTGTSATDTTSSTGPTASATTDSSTTGVTSTSDTASTSSGDTGSSDGTGTTGPADCECVEGLDDGVFVLSDDAELWKYKPEDNMFEFLGDLQCGAMTSTFSMSVDRLGFAWIMFSSPAGEIWRADVQNPANCVDPGYMPGQQGVELFGMAFVSKDEVNQCDKLYGNTFTGIGGLKEGPNLGDFIVVDPDSLLLTVVGPTDYDGAELTGTGDGRAFMFGGVNPAKLIEMDKDTGMVQDILPLGNLSLTSAFAFAFFAGDFYFFTESAGPGSNSKVTHLDYDDSDMNNMQDLTDINLNAPIRVVGAGVSTCAPFEPT